MGKNTQDFLVSSSMHLNQSSVLSYSIIVCFVVRDVDVKLLYYLYPDIDISNYGTDYTKYVMIFDRVVYSVKWRTVRSKVWIILSDIRCKR